MAIDLLNNCHFDLTRIKKLYIGSTVVGDLPISYPIYYNTVADGTDSIIIYSSIDMSIVTIGGQNIQMDEVLNTQENITFTEELIIDQRSKNYKKTLSYEIPGINLDLVNKIEENTIDQKSKLLAILVDENDNELIVGYDNPLGLETITSSIDGDLNAISIVLSSTSKSRARNTKNSGILPPVFPTPSPTPTVSLSRTPSNTSSVGASPTRTPTPTRSFPGTPTPTRSLSSTPSITPTITPSLSISSTQTPTPSITNSNIPTRTSTVTPTVTPSLSLSSSMTPTPSITPSVSISSSPGSTMTPSPTPTSTPMVGIPFTTEWTVSGDTTARTITLPLTSGHTYNDYPPTGFTYDAYVDWGDGSSLSHITTYNGSQKVHTYSSNGVYQIKIYGECPGFGFDIGADSKNVDGNNLKLTDIINWGNSAGFGGFSNMRGAFYECYNLKSTGTGKILVKPDLWNMEAVFGQCISLNGITPGLFDNCTNVPNMNGLFASNYNTGITSIPTDLFRYCTGVTDLGLVFFGCTSLVSVPNDIFKYNTNLTSLGAAFMHCSSLTGVTSDLFMYNTLVTNMVQVFWYCSSLTTVPTDLFKYNTEVVSFAEIFGDCTNLATIPDGLFKYNIKCTDFTGAFIRCNKLQLNPWTFCLSGETNNRFYNQSINFCDTFARLSFTGIQGTAPDLWNYNYGTGTTISYCYGDYTFDTYSGNNPTSIINYCDIPPSWGGVPCPSVTITPTMSPSITPSISPSLTPSISRTPSRSTTPSVTMPSPSRTPSITPSVSTSATEWYYAVDYYDCVGPTCGSLIETTSIRSLVILNVGDYFSAIHNAANVVAHVTAITGYTSNPSDINGSGAGTCDIICAQIHPSPTPSRTVSKTPTPSISPSISTSLTPSISRTPSITPSISITPTMSPSITPSITPSISPSPSYVAPAAIDFLIVGGGGGGGVFGGGGGAGGFVYVTGQTISTGSYSIMIGTGGTGSSTCDASDNIGQDGGDSSFSGITAYGGGGGGGRPATQAAVNGRNGASGGGGSACQPYTESNGGSATHGSQGNAGGKGINQVGSYGWAGGGGGGAGSAGSDGQALGGNNGYGGNGGDGLPCSITGGTAYFAGGGGAFGYGNFTTGLGGLGGGGNGGTDDNSGYNATPNTGGGGGAAGYCGSGPVNGGNGGSGVVIVRYLTSSFGTCSGGDVTTDGSYTIRTFNSSGTLVLG